MTNNRNRKLITAGIITVGVLVLVGMILNANKRRNEEKTAIVAGATGSAVAVRTSTVQRAAIDREFVANGNFVPSQQLNFAAENAGRVVHVLVDEGSRVRVGQTLAIIKTDALNVDLETARAAYETALRDKQRFESAFKTGGVTRQQLDQMELNLENASARLAQTKIRMNDAHIKSSINGIVNKRYIEPGAVVSPGTQLFEIVDVSSLKLQVAVDEKQVATLKNGDKVLLKVSVYPNDSFMGNVTFIAPKADNTLNFPVEIVLEKNPGEQLKAGMYGTAFFRAPATMPALIVPRAAFVGSVNAQQVFMLAADSTAQLRTVVAGSVLNDKVEILSGLAEGDKVITSGQINLQNGSRVTIIQ